MYSSYKKKRAVSQQQARAVFFIVFAIIAASVFFFSYRFYQHASGSSVYSIGKGNKYVNMISNSLYGPEIEEKEEEALDYDEIQQRQEEVIRNALKEIRRTKEKSEWSFESPSFLQLEKVQEQNKFSKLPIVVFTSLSNPVWHSC